MPRRRLRIGLIGCGGNMRWAHLPRLAADGSVELVGAFEPDERRYEDLASAWGRPVPRYASPRRMLAGAEPDAIVISSPHTVHHAQVKLALASGCHVMCEKPLTTTARHARELLAMARRRRRILVVAYQRHHLAPQRRVRQLIRAGRIGRLRGVVAYVTQNWAVVGGWRLDPALSGGGAFMDTGSHLVAAVLWMTGLEPSLVSALVDKVGRPVDINTVVGIQFRGGATGTLAMLGDASRHDERIAIHGDKGCIVFHMHDWQVKSVLLNDEPLKLGALKDSTPDADFLRWIRNGGRGYESPTFALQVARVSESAYRSDRLKRPVRVSR